MAKKKADMSAARNLAAAIGTSGMTPSEAIMVGGSVNNAPSAHNAHDVPSTHDAQATTSVNTKRKRINMAFSNENIEDMRLAANAMGVSQTEFTNMVLREWFDAHESDLAAFRSARSKFEV